MLGKIFESILLVVAYVGMNCLLLLALILTIYLMISLNKEMIGVLGGLFK